eukprot:scaffold49383_cov27-Tisochrysis_lutea.AAC.1
MDGATRVARGEASAHAEKLAASSQARPAKPADAPSTTASEPRPRRARRKPDQLRLPRPPLSLLPIDGGLPYLQMLEAVWPENTKAQVCGGRGGPHPVLLAQPVEVDEPSNGPLDGIGRECELCRLSGSL